MKQKYLLKYNISKSMYSVEMYFIHLYISDCSTTAHDKLQIF